MSVLHTINT